MPALNFKVFVDKVESGAKSQTIRPPRKYPVKLGDKLYLYIGMRTKNCRKLGEAVCSEIIPIGFTFWRGDFCFFIKSEDIYIDDLRIMFLKEKDEIIRRDGFRNLKEFQNFFIETYKLESHPYYLNKFDIIRWRNFERS